MTPKTLLLAAAMRYSVSTGTEAWVRLAKVTDEETPAATELEHG